VYAANGRIKGPKDNLVPKSEDIKAQKGTQKNWLEKAVKKRSKTHGNTKRKELTFCRGGGAW